MIINQENMNRLYTAFNILFNAAFQGAEIWYPKAAMTVPATTRIMDYRFLLNFPMVQEWLDERQIRSMSADAYLVETKDWEATVEVDRNDIEDEQLGLYNPIITGVGNAAKKHPDKLTAGLMKDGFVNLCYDKKAFFAADHKMGKKSFSNTGGGAGSPWFLLDTSQAIKPFVFQLRRGAQLVRMDRPDDEEAFMRKKFRYGVDYRAAGAYGLWQLAFGSKDTLNATNYAAARATMQKYTNADGVPLGIRPNLMVVHPDLESQARTLLQAQFIIGDPTVGGSQTNIWQGTADLLVVPELV